MRFRWNAGFAAIQKKRNVAALHDAAQDLGLCPLLEISTKSEEPLGRSLSAFNFKVGVAPDSQAPIEVAYQGSKVFEHGGPYAEMFVWSPREAKRDVRLRESGSLIGFKFGGKDFPLSPPTAFYTWLSLRAFAREPEPVRGLADYSGFTDIEFNPKKSLNCQARACAVAVSLSVLGELQTCAKSFSRFVQVLSTGQPFARPPVSLQHQLVI